MGLPRSRYVREEEEGVYHCFSRCVRRAFLYGFDALTRRDFSDRKAWVVERLRYLAAVFAIEVCAYAVMENHYHTILRTRPDIAASWSNREVATRWLTLFPGHRNVKRTPIIPAEEEIRILADRPERIAQLRQRLSSLSWFMGQLNEFIARAANKEDQVKGRFWEGRFKCQALLDDAAIASCMVYVDLNPIRAGMAGTPEESGFRSIQERIRAWRRETMITTSVPSQEEGQDMRPASLGRRTTVPENSANISGSIPGRISDPFDSWLCPIHAGPQRRGILEMTSEEYFNLVDKSGRMTRSDKPGAIHGDLAPILLRIGANPNTWLETVSRFGSRFRLAAGLASNLRAFADRLGRRWLQGIATARAAFAPQPSLLA
jgi:REP element-mobilizing transposase RayT